ncbi:hypothetical protein Sjap_023561 [Stephania japonica]|uniref:Uncharacterized protein n=1 Tax=Stephania japonica TaxID=461633 RepID=A0AAP0EKA9_9MAGN
MAEASNLVVAGVEEVVKRLVSLGIEEAGLIRGVKEEVDKLQTFLNHIQLVLQDADKRQMGDGSVKLWLKELKEAALDAEDLLEEFAYDGLLPHKLTGEQRGHKVRKFLSCFTTLKLRSNTAHSIRDINKRLEDIDKKKDTFNFIRETNTTTAEYNYVVSDSIVPVAANDRETTSMVIESDVFGREDDKKKIVDMLIHGSSGSNDPGSSIGAAIALSVMTILGFGGLGKTTLAQLVFNDAIVKEHFGSTMIWVCVSEDFAITTIWLKILKEIDSSTQSESMSKQELQKKLEKELSGKKFLVVLDDFWQKGLDKWEDLILPLKLHGAAGSKVVVTTREEIVASTIGSHYIHRLQFLSDDQCLSLFESRAFMQGEPTALNLVEIGKEIVKKCGGVPLAVKVLGGLMRSKRTEQEWLDIRDGEFWELGADVQRQVIEILKLSYNNLPPKVRQCFSYCSIFPKDYEIQKHEVIQLWMAQGFLKTFKEGELMEDIGEEYIRILCTISFFQIAVAREKVIESTELIYKMHDLVHDVAQYLSKFECKDLVNDKDDKINENIRHLSLISSNKTLEIPKGINKMTKLRSFYSFPTYANPYDRLKVTTSLPMLLQLRFLRVLSLSRLPLKELPSSIGGLKLLKYLDLSWSKIERLPSTISNLYNLQTFNLSNCEKLYELPKSVGTLTQLRYFYTYCIHARNRASPRGLNELTFLQMLDILKLCAECASEHIAELEHLNYLGGTLRLQNLGYVNDVKVVEKANFMGKKNLHTLDMNWGPLSGTQGDNASHHDELLEALGPHSDLKELMIRNFQGLKLPGWMTNNFVLPNLVKLQLKGCHKCKEIKSLGELCSLKELVIEKMDSLSRIGEDHHNLQVAESLTTTATEVEGPEAAAILYPCLEKLSIRYVPNLEEWFENSADIFPKLEKLELRWCPKLRNMPNHFPSLQKLSIGNVNSDTVRSITKNITSLSSFSFEGSSSSSSSSSKKEEEEVARMISKNKLLESLTVKVLSSMRCMPHLSPTLKKLEIINCPVLKIESARLPCVGWLWISDVKAFVVDDNSWSNKLSFLYVSDVPEFVQLPVDFLRNNMHLRIIRIKNCRQFEGFLSSNEEEIGSSSCCVETLALRDCPSILGLQLQGFTQLEIWMSWAARGSSHWKVCNPSATFKACRSVHFLKN